MLSKPTAKLFLLVSFSAFILFSSACTVSQQYKHNNQVKQQVIEDYGDSVLIKAGEIYAAGKMQRFWLGNHYRDIWLTPVVVPKLDFDTVLGGLTIQKKGGGQQTYSLKVTAANGKPYALRSLQKDPSAALPKALRRSFADDVVQDQISASNPYAPFILPELGDSIGIYHTNPKLYYISDSPDLGEYREDFGGVLVMLEEDADENWEHYESFGYTKNAIGTEKLLEELEADNDNQIDQEDFLKVRLFDMWIGDWDRHQGQYRWAKLPDGKGSIYRAIPEDRDNMFFRSDGVLPWIASRKWALRKFKDFYDVDLKDIGGLNWQARHLDRRLLSGLSRAQWLKVAADLQNSLTDEAIAESLKKMPEPVHAMSADTLLTILKQRRELLKDYAERYYQILAKEVDVVGSNKNELFLVERMQDGITHVRMYKTDDDGEEKKELLFERNFLPQETNEIRLYGLESEDYFLLSGEGKKGIVVRIIGGAGEDKLVDSSRVRGCGDKTIYYDNSNEDNDIEEWKETKLVLKRSKDNNSYDFKDFEYDYLGPSLYLGFNSDYGAFIGGGVLIRTHSFKKYPYASEQRIVANFAPTSKSWNFKYEGDFVKVFDDAGVNITAEAEAPNYFSNFYGFGNEIKGMDPDPSSDYYHVEYNKYLFEPNLKFRIGENSSVKMGPSYRMIDVAENKHRFYSEQNDSLSSVESGQTHYLGLVFEADIRTVANVRFPKKGIWWKVASSYYNKLDKVTPRFAQIRSDLSAYYTFDLPFKTTLAARIGGATNAGEFAFYDGNSIGGNEGFSRPGTVRGYHRDRFMGRTSLYQNSEVRIKLLNVPFYFLPFTFGISGHHDVGRVWADGEKSEKWHSAMGGGVWFGPLANWVFTFTYTTSEEGEFVNANMGFLF